MNGTLITGIVALVAFIVIATIKSGRSIFD